MSESPAVRYEVLERVARITLDRPERGNGITPRMIEELVGCVERADLDPAVHVLLLAGSGSGFCGGYDLVESAEGMAAAGGGPGGERFGSPLDPGVIAANHDPAHTWDAMVDYAMMSRNVRGFMSLFNCGKPVVCKVHGFCVAGGTDLALCAVVVGGDHAWVQWRARALDRDVTASAGALALGALHQVIPTAEARPTARQQQHVNRGVKVCALDAARELLDHSGRDAVAALGAVEGDPCDPLDNLIANDRRRAHHATIL